MSDEHVAVSVCYRWFVFGATHEVLHRTRRSGRSRVIDAVFSFRGGPVRFSSCFAFVRHCDFIFGEHFPKG